MPLKLGTGKTAPMELAEAAAEALNPLAALKTMTVETEALELSLFDTASPRTLPQSRRCHRVMARLM